MSFYIHHCVYKFYTENGVLKNQAALLYLLLRELWVSNSVTISFTCKVGQSVS